MQYVHRYVILYDTTLENWGHPLEKAIKGAQSQHSAGSSGVWKTSKRRDWDLLSGVGDKATSILSLLLSSLCTLSHPKLVHISTYLLFLSSLFQFLHLTSCRCHPSLCACLLTQNWCIPEWDNSKDSRLQVMSAASHYNWTFCGPVSATALFCIRVFFNLSLNSDSYLLSSGPDAVVQFLLQLCFVYV